MIPAYAYPDMTGGHDDDLELLEIPLLFGSFLVHIGLVTEADLTHAARLQKDLNADPIVGLIERGLLSVADLKRVRAHQHAHLTGFREAMRALGILSEADYRSALEAIRGEHIRLGELLVKQGRLDQATLAVALARHREYQEAIAAQRAGGEAQIH